MASDLINAVVLGVIEGLTEFLPISSTGHLVVAERVLGFRDDGEVFTVVIQLGAILAVCVYFHARLWQLGCGVVRGEAGSLRFLRNLVIAALPVAVAGLACNHWMEAHLFTVAVVAATTAVGGLAIMIIERRPRTPRHHDPAALPWTTALGVGGCQLLALIPGVSRSGASILGGMLLGIDRLAATQFSFFLAIPIMFGASGLKLIKHRHELSGDRLGLIAIGFAVAFVTALAVVHALIRYVSHRDFIPFAWYRLAVGLLLAVLLVTGVFTSFT